MGVEICLNSVGDEAFLFLIWCLIEIIESIKADVHFSDSVEWVSLPNNFVNWQDPDVAVRQYILTLWEFGAKYLDLKFIC